MKLTGAVPKAAPALLGSALAAAGWLGAGSIGGALAWAGAVLLACLGYGAAVGRGAARLQGAALPALPLPLVGVIGYAALTVAGTALAQGGLFGSAVQLGAVLLGQGLWLGFGAALPRRAPARRLGVAPWIGVALAGGLIALMRLFSVDRVISDDEINHVMALARLWDVGDLLPMRLSLGGQVVGEALASLAAGAEAPFLLDGLCALALLALSLSLLPARGGLALPGLAAIAWWMVMFYAPGGVLISRWPMVLLCVASFALLRQLFDEAPLIEPSGAPDGAANEAANGAADGGANRGANGAAAAGASAASRRGERALLLLLAAALATLRNELVPVALVLAVAALCFGEQGRARRWTRGQRAGALVAAFVALALLGAASGTPLPLAFGKSAACLVAVPLVLLLLLFAGTFAWWSALGAALLALVVGLLSSRLGLMPIGVRSFATGLALLTQLPFLIALLLEKAPRRAHLYPVTAALVFVWMFTDSLNLAVYRDVDRGRLPNRLTELGARAELAYFSGLAANERSADERLRSLQGQVPRGARLGLWGRSAAKLDYRRNPIRDVSWTAVSAHRRSNRPAFLGGLTDKSLAGLDYVIVESFVAPLRERDDVFDRKTGARNPTYATPTLLVADRLELVALVGNEKLYRVRQ